MSWTENSPAGLLRSPGWWDGVRDAVRDGVRDEARDAVRVEQRWLLVPSAGTFHPKR